MTTTKCTPKRPAKANGVSAAVRRAIPISQAVGDRMLAAGAALVPQNEDELAYSILRGTGLSDAEAMTALMLAKFQRECPDAWQRIAAAAAVQPDQDDFTWAVSEVAKHLAGLALTAGPASVH